MAQTYSTPDYVKASGFELAKDYYYHDGHTWVRIEHGGMARIGFDAFIMKLFGKAEFLPGSMGIGSHMVNGEPGWSITQDNQTAKVISPISGTVLSVNQRVRENPALMHEDPYNEGWLFMVEPDSQPMKALKKLSHGEDSIIWLKKEHIRLIAMMGPDYEKLAATGGEPVNDFYGFHPEIGWDKLVRNFLKT
ncbi:MAG: glycine cleavage system protein H [Pseudomonadota bacterium]